MNNSWWLVKADPENDYSIDDLAKDGHTIWDGVHNNQAILNIQKMKTGDKLYFYHSQKEKSIVGLAEVVSEPYENTDDPRRSWAMKIKFIKKFKSPIHLSIIKSHPEFNDFLLVRNSRLSVMPVAPKHQKVIEKLLVG
jgi:predicted RNA-binding protein with PUA-like domain